MLRIFCRVAAMLAVLVVSLVALRRIFIDFESILRGCFLEKGEKGYIPKRFRRHHEEMLEQLTKPLLAGGLPLGVRRDWRRWMPKDKQFLTLPPKVREQNPHILVVGSSGTGKTRYLANMIKHDIESDDRAIVVLDSSGDLVNILVDWLASHKRGAELSKRTIVVNPDNPNCSLGYNPLLIRPDTKMQDLASSIVWAFQSLSTEPPGSQSQWNAQTANILRNSILLLLVNNKSFVDLPTLLQDNDYRDELLETLSKRTKISAEFVSVFETWSQYKRLARTDQWITWIEPILNRIGPALSDSRIRSILTAEKNDIDLASIVSKKQILLVKMSESSFSSNAELLGALIINGLPAAVASQNMRSGDDESRARLRVAIYADRLDVSVGLPAFERIAAVGEIGLIGAVSSLQMLAENFRNSLLTGVGTLVCLGLSKKDANLLSQYIFRSHRVNNSSDILTGEPATPIGEQERELVERLVAQDHRDFYCYRVGTVAGVFHLRTHEFGDFENSKIDRELVARINNNRVN